MPAVAAPPTNSIRPPDSVLTTQAAFRAVLDAMASPGSVRALAVTTGAPPLLASAAAAVALTLCDHDTPVWLDRALRGSESVCAWLRLHCGCRLVSEPREAAFCFVAAPRDLPPIEAFSLGTPDYPDRSATIVIQAESLRGGPPIALSGPGIRDTQVLRASGLPDDMPARLVANRALFPRGVDFILASGDELAALPRSVRLADDRE